MQETPARSIRFIHTAIQKAATEIEDIALENNPDLTALAEKVAFLERVNKVHTAGEEAFMFPAIQKFAPDVPATYLRDHRSEDEIFTEVKQLITTAQADPNPPLNRLRRQAIALAEHLQDHLGKENELIVPLLEKNLSFPEQGQMVSGIISHIPPQENPVIFPWIVRAQTPDDAAIFIQAAFANMPPPVQGMAKGWIKDGVSPELWGALTQRVPALGE